jgi:hypothetical protein
LLRRVDIDHIRISAAPVGAILLIGEATGRFKVALRQVQEGAGVNSRAGLAAEAERQVRPSTICRRVAAIRYAPKLADLPLPTDDERV